jgi:isopenicillin N synthase-like dioxygenase
MITVPAQDGVAGLQTAGEAHPDAGRRQWVDVKPVPSALVINVGYLL